MGLVGDIQLGRLDLYYATRGWDCESYYVGPGGGMCTLSGLRKRCLSSREGCTRVEEGENSESLDVEWKSVVCICGAGACEVGV